MLLSVFSLEFLGAFVTALLCVIGTAAWYLHQQHLKYDHLPGPPRDSFWSGHFPSIAKVKAAGGVMDDYFIEMSKTHGLLFRLFLWNQVIIVCLDPACIKDVLVTGNHPKSIRMYSRFQSLYGVRFIGQGVGSLVDRKLWIIQRMQLDQWFKPHFIRQFASEFNEFGDRFVELMKTRADGKTETHMLDLLNKLTMHLLYKVAFNVEMGPFSGENHPFVTKMKTALSGVAANLTNPFVAMNPFNWKFCRDSREAITFIRESARQQIIDRKLARDRGDYIPRDLLEYLIELKEKYPSVINDEILLDNVLTFLLAGQETTANALNFMLFLLGENPECYKKLQREIDEHVGAVSVITLNELEKLSYLDMVLKETLRLYPLNKITSRETKYEFRLGDHLIPANTDMIVSFYATSRLEKNFTEPTKFMPERFQIDSSEKFSKYAYTPFSIGPRICIGKKFAEIEIKITIVKIMQNIDFELVPGQSAELLDTAALRLKSGTMCLLRQRKMESD
ncbi:cholesterol 24-hydroxylase-like isoform X1 [Pecten maximus]|uniref:cholesterol 24-hydroxylase-like isoform X1 n=1 Tax=Pecten maximus TaxID=6579 RepID=UPI00145859A1|nr:cholesterol 24-hydroxylase-like isoform X1 [Pecten maximus]